jgi:Na+-driven multidrug efflux pump
MILAMAGSVLSLHRNFSRRTTAELLRIALPMVVSQGTFAVMIFTDRYFMSQINILGRAKRRNARRSSPRA